MKNKGIIIGVVAAVIVLIVVGVILLLNPKDKGITNIITLDINPSIELELKDGKVNRASALDGDANDYISGLEEKTLEEAFDSIIKKAKENNLAEDGNITIILGMETNDSKIEETLKEVCNKNVVVANIIVPVVTEEAKNEAKAHGVSAAKAAYILEVVKENTNLKFEDIAEKSSEELKEIKTTGKYCDEGYTLSGDFCEKVVKEESPKEDKVCPEGYIEASGKCYLKGESTQEAYCKTGYELKNNKCVGTDKVDATASCATGTYNSKTGKCEVLALVGDATKKCNNAEDLLLDNGRCAGAHPGAHSYGDNDEPFDEATECCCGDTFKNGWCYSLPNGNYDAKISCPSGQTEKDGKCYKAETSDATFSCSKGTLEGNKCVVEVSKNPEFKASCSNGLKLYQDKYCLDYNSTKDYIVGYVCDGEGKLVDGKCLFYDVVDAKTA